MLSSSFARLAAVSRGVVANQAVRAMSTAVSFPRLAPARPFYMNPENKLPGLPDFPVETPPMVPGTLYDRAGAPGVVLLHEWWGVTDAMEAAAKKLNGMGYRVIVPDLYRGKSTTSWEDAADMMRGLDYVEAVQDINGAVAYLKETGSSKVAVVGFCLGGALSHVATSLSPHLVDAGVAFYGKAPESLKVTPELMARPMQFHFGDLDSMQGVSDYAAVDDFEETLKAAETNAELHRYPEGHWFMNESAKMQAVLSELGVPAVNEKSQVAAWDRVDTFLKANL